jgi:putative lumazine-binding protein
MKTEPNAWSSSPAIISKLQLTKTWLLRPLSSLSLDLPHLHSALACVALLTACAGPTPTSMSNQPIDPIRTDSTQADDQKAVIAVVKQFLTAAGDYDLEAMAQLFAPGANIGSAALRDGVWSNASIPYAQWQASLGDPADATRYTEPVSKFTVHVDHSQLAFVRANAMLLVDGTPKAHNMDYFMLIRLDGNWKILSAAYTSILAEPPKISP